jgi:allantoin racemase
MKVLILNPNTTAALTSRLVAIARTVAAPDTEVVGAQPSWGVPAVQGYRDGFVSAAASLECAQARLDGGEQWDATVYAGFGDHGREGLQELLDGPVVSIAEAAAQTACLLGHRYAVITTLARSVPQIRDMLSLAGLDGRCDSVLATGVPVLGDPGVLQAAFDEAAGRALAAGAEVICLGSAAMAGWSAAAGERLGVPVVDGLTAAVTAAESLVRLGLTTSRRNAFGALPPG